MLGTTDQTLYIMTKDAARLVLVVEDDLSVRRPLVKFLEMHGFSVVTAETAEEGLEGLSKHQVAAAVVDLRLKRGSGRDVVVSAPADVPGIIFSGVPSSRPSSSTSVRGRAASRNRIRSCCSSRRSKRCSRKRAHRIFIPSAESASSVPSWAVAFCTSSIGFTSTRSSEVSAPESATISIIMCASR